MRARAKFPVIDVEEIQWLSETQTPGNIVADQIHRIVYRQQRLFWREKVIYNEFYLQTHAHILRFREYVYT